MLDIRLYLSAANDVVFACGGCYDDRDLSSCKMLTTKTRRYRAKDLSFMSYIPKWKKLADMKQTRRNGMLVIIPTGQLSRL